MNSGTSLYYLIGIHSGNRRRSFIIIWLLCLTTCLSAQNKLIHGTVVSQLSGEKIAFASLSWKRAGSGCVSDSNGRFIIYPRYGEDTLVVSHVGYYEVSLPVRADRDYSSLIVVLSEKEESRVMVNKKYNRGLLWWKKVVQHKAINDPRQFKNITCDLYKKMEMDLTNISKERIQESETFKTISVFDRLYGQRFRK